MPLGPKIVFRTYTNTRTKCETIEKPKPIFKDKTIEILVLSDRNWRSGELSTVNLNCYAVALLGWCPKHVISMLNG